MMIISFAFQVPGKIVLYNQGFASYGQSGNYRTNGAAEAAKVRNFFLVIRHRSINELFLFIAYKILKCSL